MITILIQKTFLLFYSEEERACGLFSTPDKSSRRLRLAVNLRQQEFSQCTRFERVLFF